MEEPQSVPLRDRDGEYRSRDGRNVPTPKDSQADLAKLPNKQPDGETSRVFSTQKTRGHRDKDELRKRNKQKRRDERGLLGEIPLHAKRG